MEREPVVDPRRIWIGMAVAVVALVVIGLGVALRSWWWAAPGVVALVVGAVLAQRAGLMADAHASSSTAQELETVVEGKKRRGIRPGTMIDAPEGQAQARDDAERLRSLQRASRRGPRPSLAPIGGVLLITVFVVTLWANSSLYPMTPTSQDNRVRTLALGIVMALVGLRILVRPRIRHPWAAAAGLVASTLMVVLAFVVSHSRPATTVLEATCGAFGLVGSLLCLDFERRSSRAADPGSA